MVSLLRHCSNLEGPRSYHWDDSGGEETPLRAVRPCGMEVVPSKALDMSRSPYLIIGYLLRGEHQGLIVIVL